ncbi:NAD-dependent protein deacylase [Vagococcus xieshaowenii]|uniref:protein acetyllysine N-acetyltransferase n=1 Tax=Vagococcus xieshaowenii TaxID=2562451 RepID=A0A4Z0D4L8_9ENTE|nr:NAD-dependent protein deacylase [Vagococcus xieshaowenii]QCA29349.1 NAD-dependent protein deacylase [Vagococcus xieshaowenii]TFZ39359.1 NAD-dependent protein deacylase [Vagococcus xieshaowenii]
MTEQEALAIQFIQQAKHLVFMTGAGVSVPSGIPDYRSLDGVYAGFEAPEYLLSHTCLKREPEKFYQFVKNLYHPEAQPNVIHQVMAELERTKEVAVITQNIDSLHQQAGQKNLIEFHGSLYHVYCQQCGKSVPVTSYLDDDFHEGCGGPLRPDVVLYEEGLDENNVQHAIRQVMQADTIVVVGTSLRVYPFAGLLDYRSPDAKVILVNKEATQVSRDTLTVLGDATKFFEKIKKSEKK